MARHFISPFSLAFFQILSFLVASGSLRLFSPGTGFLPPLRQINLFPNSNLSSLVFHGFISSCHLFSSIYERCDPRV